jgi:transposase
LSLKCLLNDLSARLGFAISKGMLVRFLKKLGYTYRRIRKRVKGKPDPEVYEQKLDQITDLIKLEKTEFLKIYYADEAGFDQVPSVPYGWQEKTVSLSYPSSRGQRLNVFGIMSSDNELYSWTSTKGIDSDFVIKAVDSFANCNKRSPISVIMVDNARIHTSSEFKAKQEEWKEQGVWVFYLPTYSPHLNRIETLWRKIRYEWLLPIDFESWGALKVKLEAILSGFGGKYTINFADF